MNALINFKPAPWMTGKTRRQRKAAKAKLLRKQEAVRAFCVKVLPQYEIAIRRAMIGSMLYGAGVVEV